MRQEPSKARLRAAIAAPDEGTTLIEVLIVMAILALVEGRRHLIERNDR